jgi:hypothetical protein
MTKKQRYESDMIIGDVSFESMLGNYYQDVSITVKPEKIDYYYSGPLDTHGIPLVDYDLAFQGNPYVDHDRHYGIHYNPVNIAQLALAHWGNYILSKNQESLKHFLAPADWLRDNLIIMPAGFGVWQYNVENPIYDLRPPWVSAMAQGQGISVLLRAFQITDDRRYLEAAELAFGSFLHITDEGGVSIYDDGNLWLEEYPARPSPHVLNGFIYSLWGVLDFYRVTRSLKALDIWQSGIRTLKINLNKYETIFYSCYDLWRYGICSSHYHQIHIIQLRVMKQLTGEDIFSDYAERWQAYQDGKCRLRRLTIRIIGSILRRMGIMSSRDFYKLTKIFSTKGENLNA